MDNPVGNPLDSVGREIAILDQHLIEVLVARMEAAQVVEHVKATKGDRQPIFRSEVEDRRITQIREYAMQRGINPHFAEQIIYAVINESCKVQMIQREGTGTYLHTIGDLSYEKLKENLLELTMRVASSYESNYAHLFPATQIYLGFEKDIILDTIKELDVDQRRSVLDIGCATGLASRLVSDYFERAVGVDISPSMIQAAMLAPENGENCTFEVGDVEDPKYWQQHNDGCFDMVVMTLGTGGDFQNLQLVLGEVHRVLSKRGRFVFSFYNADPLMGGYAKIPWITSLAAIVDVERECLDVHFQDQVFSLFARCYTLEQIEEMLPRNLVVTDSYTCPTVSPTVPSSVLEDAGSYEYFRALDHRLAAQDNHGAYLLVTGRKS